MTYPPKRGRPHLPDQPKEFYASLGIPWAQTREYQREKQHEHRMRKKARQAEADRIAATTGYDEKLNRLWEAHEEALQQATALKHEEAVRQLIEVMKAEKKEATT